MLSTFPGRGLKTEALSQPENEQQNILGFVGKEEGKYTVRDYAKKKTLMNKLPQSLGPSQKFVVQLQWDRFKRLLDDLVGLEPCKRYPASARPLADGREYSALAGHFTGSSSCDQFTSATTLPPLQSLKPYKL